MSKHYYLSEVMEKTGATARQIQHWSRIGLLPFASKTNLGNHQRIYNLDDICVAWVLVRVSNSLGGLPSNKDFSSKVSEAVMSCKTGMSYGDIEISWGEIPIFETVRWKERA